MNRRYFIFLWCLIILFLSSPFVIPSPVYAAVVINEVLPKMSDPTQEWVELYNNGSDAVSLDRWTLQNTTGDIKKFTMIASSLIQPNGFLVFYGSQTGISFNKDGDTLQLINEKNETVDSENFPGTLGYNTSMGRSQDGAGVWTFCTGISTPNQANGGNCPAPSPTPSPLPTATPLPTAVPATPLPTSPPQTEAPAANPPAVQTMPGSTTANTAQLSLAQVLGVHTKATPTPTPADDLVKFTVPQTIHITRSLAAQILIVVGAWAAIAISASVNKKKRRKVPKSPQPLSQ